MLCVVETRRLSRDEQREQTRQRLMDAAERLFAERGIGDTSIEQIAEEAGFSRGAFYSNFDDREALVLALLERRNELNRAENVDIATRNNSPAEFLERVFERAERQTHIEATIGMEYILWAARNPASRPKLKELRNDVLVEHTKLVRTQYVEQGQELPIDTEFAAKILLALDEGFALLRLLDPEGYPVTIWNETIAVLNEAMIALIEKRAAAD